MAENPVEGETPGGRPPDLSAETAGVRAATSVLEGLRPPPPPEPPRGPEAGAPPGGARRGFGRVEIPEDIYQVFPAADRDKVRGMDIHALDEYREKHREDRPDLSVYITRLQMQKMEEQRYGSLNPLYWNMLRPDWTKEEKREWLHQQFRQLAESRALYGEPSNRSQAQLLESAKTYLKDAELDGEYEVMYLFYNHFATLLNSKDLQPITESARLIKSRHMNYLVRMPLVAEAMRVWERHGSYRDYLGESAPRYRDGTPIETSYLFLQDGALQLRKLEMIGEMMKYKLGLELRKKYEPDIAAKLEQKKELTPAELASWDQADAQAKDNVRDYFIGERSLSFYEKADEENRCDDLQLAAEYRIRKDAMVNIAQAFIKGHHLDDAFKTFFTKEGYDKVEAGLNRWKAEGKDLGEVLFDDAQFGLNIGELGWRTFERSSLLDTFNPYETKPEGGGENPLRRLLNFGKYMQELIRDGKIPKGQRALAEAMDNPVRDFLSEQSDGKFWRRDEGIVLELQKRREPEIAKKIDDKEELTPVEIHTWDQAQAAAQEALKSSSSSKVRDWFDKIINDSHKVDRYGRFTDLSDCPFEELEFGFATDIPDRSPLTPHYSNYFETAEELRHLVLQPDNNFLIQPKFQLFLDMITKGPRNLRSEYDPEHEQTRRDALERREAERRNHLPYTRRVVLPSREQWNAEVFSEFMQWGEERRAFEKEAVDNWIEVLSDPENQRITPEYAQVLRQRNRGRFPRIKGFLDQIWWGKAIADMSKKALGALFQGIEKLF